MVLDGKSITSVDYVALGTSMYHVAWPHVTLGIVLLDHILTFLNHCTPPESHEIFKTHRIIIIFIFFMGNYIAFKNYTKNFKLFHKFYKKPIFINCKNLSHLRNGISA